MRPRHHIALLLVLAALGCAREEGDRAAPAAVSTSSTSSTSAASEASEPDQQGLSPSASAPADESYPMPGPERKRLGAAVALNATCVSCHKEEADEWHRSRHRQSNTNAAYQAAFATEPAAFCSGCHAPEAEPTTTKTTTPRAVSELGVGCVTCHVTEEGFVLAATSTSPSAAPHPLRRSADFAQTGGCAGCHEFRFPGAIGDDDAHFMQTTAREHARSPAADRACADCHMPLVQGRRSHAFAEVRDPAWLRESLHAAAELSAEGRVRVTLAQTDPGHAFPTGDLFRRLEVGCESRDADGKVVAREVRHLARHFELLPGRPGRVLTRDNRVFEEPSVIEMALSPAPPGRRPAAVAWWVTLQRVATVGSGSNPAEAKIESSVPLYAGVLPLESNERSEREHEIQKSSP